MKVIVTGASGVLGSAIFNAFKASPNFDVLGLARSRPTPSLKQIDLLDEQATEALVKDYKPDWVIHCAAERRPDVAQKDPEGARKLNASVPLHLARLAASYNFLLFYISTDYVFDGTAPPYAPGDSPNPLQLYGVTKRDGEIAVLGVEGARVVVLRVPVLYGPAPNNSDSAINILVDIVKDQSGKQYTMDHYATRYPTNVIDIADFLVRLSTVKEPYPRIIHYSASEPFTKYEITLLFAAILGLPHKHITPDAEPPKGADAATRPRDSQLDVRETEALLGGGGLGGTGFEEWWREYLGQKA